jgi:hypothetical protein
MIEKRMIKCPVCESKFIPRTFYPENAIFSSPDGKRFYSGFEGYINAGGIKPPEVVLGYWITYCPKCNYILKFVKEIVKKEKVHVHSSKITELTEKYNNYYFGFEFGDYSQYLKEVSQKVQAQIQETLQSINFEIWEKLYSLKDNFKFLVRFFTNLEYYCDNLRGLKDIGDMPNKIKKLRLPKEVELVLLQLNNIKNEIVKGDYELSDEENQMIEMILVRFVLYLINSHIKPLINEDLIKNGYEFINLKDLSDEIKLYLASYLYSSFNSDPRSSHEIKKFLEDNFITISQ